eukprot:scaffold108244_cov22-Tisochrysis_lutea.AAC.1
MQGRTASVQHSLKVLDIMGSTLELRVRILTITFLWDTYLCCLSNFHQSGQLLGTNLQGQERVQAHALGLGQACKCSDKVS